MIKAREFTTAWPSLPPVRDEMACEKPRPTPLDLAVVGVAGAIMLALSIRMIRNYD